MKAEGRKRLESVIFPEANSLFESTDRYERNLSERGKFYGSITNEWRSLIIGTGEDTQIMGVGSYAVTPTAPVQLNVQWVPTGKIRLKKIDAETQQGKPQGRDPLRGRSMKFSTGTVRSRIRLRQTKRERRFQSCSPMGFTRYGKSRHHWLYSCD